MSSSNLWQSPVLLGLLTILLISFYFVFLIPRKLPTPFYLLPTDVVLSDRPLNQSRFVGSHDSASYQLLDNVFLPGAFHTNSNIVSTLPVDMLSNLQKWCSMCQRVLANWTLTQKHNIKGQLKEGVRALDLRVALGQDKYSGDDVYVYAHALPTVYVKDVLEQIRSFLDENVDAFIIISSKPDVINESTMKSDEAQSGYLKLVSEVLGSKLYPFSGFGFKKSPREIVKSGHQILFIHSSNPQHLSWVWPITTLSGKWFPEPEEEKAYETYKSQLVSLPTSSSSNLTQVFLIATANQDYIFEYYKKMLLHLPFFIPYSSRIDKGERTQREWFCRLKEDIPADKLKHVNIWWVDAPSKAFVKAIYTDMDKNLPSYCVAEN